MPAPPLPVLPSVSSTEIRAALAEGDLDAVRGRVPSAVLDYIEAHRLYRGADT
jgi:nicotinate-nucleotide adenylyltransferase